MENYSKFGDIIPADGVNHMMFNEMYITKKGYGSVNLVYWHDSKYQNPLYLFTNLEYPPLAERFIASGIGLKLFSVILNQEDLIFIGLK